MRIRLILSAVFLMTFLNFSTAARAAGYPRVTFEYAVLYDRFCADMTKKAVEREAVEEIEKRLDEFRAEWEKQAPRLFKTAVN